MKNTILVSLLFFLVVPPVFCEDDVMFTIYSYSPNTVRPHPVKKLRFVKTHRLTKSNDWTNSTFEDPFVDWEAPAVTLRSVVGDKYMQNEGLVDYDKSVVQTDLYVSFKNGFYIDVWNSMPFKKNAENLGVEMDYNIGWTGVLSGQTSIDIGAAYCDLPTLGRMGGADDMVYSYIKLSHPVTSLNLYVVAENSSPMPQSSYQGGSLLSVGISKSDTYLDKDLTVDMSLEPVYDTGEYNLSSGMFVRGKIGFSWVVEKGLTFILPQVNYFVPITIHDSRKPGTAITSGFAYQF